MIAHLRIAHQVANPEVGNPEIHLPTRCANRDQRIHPHHKLLCQKAEKREERKRLEMQQENEDPRNQNASKWVKFKWEAICSDCPIGGE